MRYIKKIKIFSQETYFELEREVNEFLGKEIELGYTVVDIQYTVSGACFSCMVYYTAPTDDA